MYVALGSDMQIPAYMTFGTACQTRSFAAGLVVGSAAELEADEPAGPAASAEPFAESLVAVDTVNTEPVRDPQC